jgi:hypothetical protein
MIGAAASEEGWMGPDATSQELPPDDRRQRGGTFWAAVILILFAAIAAVSFVVEQTMTLSNHAVPPPAHSNSH